MTDFFSVISTTNGARTGILTFNDGTQVRTPTFMPVGTRGAVKSLSPELVKSTGAGILLANTYHLHLSPGEEVVKNGGGTSKWMRWHGPMLTDSGGFQVFSLGKIRKITEEGVKFRNPVNGDVIFISPEKSIQIQHDLGADIIMAFDDVVDLHNERHRQPYAMKRTHEWLERCVSEHERLLKLNFSNGGGPKLFGIVQGGLDKNLRLESLEFIQSQPVDGIAIGGLSVGETREEMHEMLEFLSDKFDDSPRPHYLMGVGHPIDMRKAIECGIDMFDCVLPTRNARHGSVWISANDSERPASSASPGRSRSRTSTSPLHSSKPSHNSSLTNLQSGDKQISLKVEKFKFDNNPIEVGCDCYACSNNFSKSWFRAQFKANEPLAGALASAHNLRYLQRLCENYQNENR